jgi:DNA polymerase-3 subunit delta
VQIKPADADRFLARPDPGIRVVLIYGGDEGLVAERTAAFVKAVTGASDDPFSHVRLEPSALAEDPGLLADEAHAVPMFGGRRAISIRLSGNWQILPALEPILAAPPADAWIVIAAGDLRKTSPIRRLAETGKAAAAVPCYADSGRDLDRIIDEETRAASLTIDAEARAALRDLIGGDRMQSRSEIAKLCLYAATDGKITLHAVRAIIGDASAFASDEAIDAVALGNAVDFARIYRRLVASGTPGFVVAGAAIRHFDFLHRARAAYDDGTSPGEIVARAAPPIFYKRRDIVEGQIALWPLARIERALALLERTMIDSRLNSAIAEDIVAQALFMAATLAATPRRAMAAQP